VGCRVLIGGGTSFEAIVGFTHLDLFSGKKLVSSCERVN
jgi:hypothetical protein